MDTETSHVSLNEKVGICFDAFMIGDSQLNQKCQENN